MGDRAIVLITDRKGTDPICGIYLHWHADCLPAWLPEAFLRMRNGDVGYSTARCIGYFHEQIPGNLSLGLLEPPLSLDDDCLQEYSHGDGGVIVIRCDTGEVRCVGGYLGKRWSPPNVPKHVDAVVASHFDTEGDWSGWVPVGIPATDNPGRY
jgi:hypothetical protein